MSESIVVEIGDRVDLTERYVDPDGAVWELHMTKPEADSLAEQLELARQ